jgi:hypothetical protein
MDFVSAAAFTDRSGTDVGLGIEHRSLLWTEQLADCLAAKV